MINLDKVFLGGHDAILDEAGRIAIPRSFRNQLEKGQIVLTRGPDSCIWLHTIEDWQERMQEIVRNADPDTAQGRDIRRRYLASAHILDLDKQGRVLVPPHLREFAGLSRDCKVTGQYDYVEIWDKERFEAKNPSQDKFDEVSEAFARKKEERELRNAGNSAHSGITGGNHAVPRSGGAE